MAAAVAASPHTAFARRRVPRVLFVCQYGSVKSPIARELLRQRARERGIAVSTFSRGITPEAHLPPEIAARLLAEGIDPARDGMHALQLVDATSAEIVVFFNPLPPGFGAAKMIDWTAMASINQNYSAARTQLDAKIEALLSDLAH